MSTIVGGTRSFLAATLAMAGVASVLVALPVSAASAPVYQPDGRISLPCHQELEDCQVEWYGDDVYNETAFDQRAAYADFPNWYDVVTVTFKMRIQNDGSRTDRFRVGASGVTAGYRVRFFAGTTDVTEAIKAGTFRTPWLAAGDSYLIKAKVKPVDPRDGDTTKRLVTISSLTDASKKDAVKLVRAYIEMTCGC